MSVALSVCEDLKEALIAHAKDCGAQIRLPIDQSNDWSGCGFRGSRHSFIVLSHDAERVLLWLQALPTASIALKRSRISDITVAWAEQGCAMTVACIDVLSIDHRSL